MSRLKIALLGFPEIKLSDRLVKSDRRKALALLAYLVVSGKSHSRDALAGFLWPDYEQESAYAYLRRTLWELNQILGKGWIEADRSSVQMAAGDGCALDTAEFEALIGPGAEADALESAIQLYRGDFMAGFSVADTSPFESWQNQQAGYYRRRFAGTLERLAEARAAIGEHEAALRHAQRWLALDPLDEAAHRTLMRVLAEMGDRTGAIRQYEHCVQILGDELNVAPQSETDALYEGILRGDITGTSKAIATPPVHSKPDEVREPTSRLPVLPTPFIGRRPEVEQIKALINDPNRRLITLIGPGGIGKTRLSIQAATEVAAAFPDGVYFVPLAPVQTAEAVLPAVARALDFPFYREAESPRQQLLDFLREKRMVLILDNFEHLLGAVDLVGDVLASAAEVKVLVTSRVRLKIPGEQLYPVVGMSVPDSETVDKWDDPETEAGSFSAVQLFLDRARRVRPGFVLTRENARPVLAICSLVQGMPLALELAAAWMELLQPSKIAAEIKRDLDFLETDQSGVPDRQRSIRAVFESSWNLLNEAEQEAFLPLCVFVGSFSREAAQAVSGASLRTLLALANKSWLQQTADGRFQLHELMRQYGDEFLHRDESAWREAKDRHAEYFAHFMQEQSARMRSEEHVLGVKALAEEHTGNVKAAWEWLVVEQRWDELIDRMLLGLFQFASIRWEFDELIPWMRAARVALAEKTGRNERLAFAIFGTLEVHCEEVIGIKDADPIKRASLIWQMVREYELADAMGFWFILLAGIVRAHNLVPEVSELIKRNIAMLRQRKEWWQLGFGLLIEANCWGDTYDKEKLLEAAEIFRELGALSEQSTVEEMLGTVAFQQRRPLAEVLRHYNNARSFLQQMEGQSRPEHNLGHLADVYFQHGDFEKAFSLFWEEQRVFERRGNMSLLAASLHWEALHATRYSTFAHARKARERSLALAQELGHPSDIVFRQYELGEVYRIFGDLEKASSLYEEARTGFEKMNMTLGLAFYQRAQGDIALQELRYADALPFFQSYQSYAEKDNHQWSRAQARSRIALTRAHLGEIDRARQEMQAVLAEIYAWRGEDLALQAMLTEPVCLIHEGNEEAAIELASFLQYYHLSWNETKTYARKIVESAALGLPSEIVQAAVERGKKLTFEDIMKGLSPGEHNVGSASIQ